jgi:hypothetical protein
VLVIKASGKGLVLISRRACTVLELSVGVAGNRRGWTWSLERAAEACGSGARTAAEDVKGRAGGQSVSIVPDRLWAGPTAAL